MKLYIFRTVGFITKKSAVGLSKVGYLKKIRERIKNVRGLEL